MSVTDLAALVCQNLKDHGIEAVLTGGAVVSIYSDNEFESKDLDFITTARQHEVAEAMAAIGFTQTKGRYFAHRNTDYFVEFPAPPLAIGNEPVRTLAKKKTKSGTLTLLTPTQCVMDRLAAVYFWSDRESLLQAEAVARKHKIDWGEVERWSRAEGQAEGYEAFRKKVRVSRPGFAGGSNA